MLEAELTAAVQKAVQILRAGGVVAAPTDTVWGLLAAAKNAAAVAKIHALKNSPAAKPLLVAVPNLVAAEQVAEFSAEARALAAAFWPGGLSLLLPARQNWPATAGQKTIGLRCPADPLSRQILEAFGGMLATTSANRHGQPVAQSAAEIQQIWPDATNCPDLILAGEAGGGLPSTLVDCTANPPAVRRVGATPVAALQKFRVRP